MHSNFLKLSKEKQARIINAGIELFGKYGYKKANTEEIAEKANISKGLLFHYFKTKEEFYFYIFDFCEAQMIKRIPTEELKQIDDFFDVLEYGHQKKIALVKDYPYMMNFILKAYFSRKEVISSEMSQRVSQIINQGFDLYFRYVNLDKFKSDVDPRRIYQMIIWMAEGYLLEKQRLNQPLCIEEMTKEFDIWKDMFKKMSYKEEYL